MAFVRQLSTNAFGEYSARPGRNTVWMAEHHQGWVAWQHQRRLGFALLDTSHEVFELTAIAVVPGERGKGTGQALLAAAERAAQHRGGCELRARTADANVAALSLFLRNGYCMRQRLPRYYSNMYAACELVKAVPPDVQLRH
jgi:ribosomal protein S18 acetylase RimI-like enzyme